MSVETMSAVDCQNYQLPAVAAPADLNPNARPYFDAPAGWHLMEIHDFEVVPDKQFRIKGEQFILDELRPKFRVVDGQPHAGGSAMDFLPMPSGPMPTMLANQWAQFIVRCGFSLPPGLLAPAGFTPAQLIGKRVRVWIEHAKDGDGKLKYKPDGEPRFGVKFFGYDYASNHTADAAAAEAPKSAATPAAKPTPVGAAPRGSTKQASAQDFDL